ncbi:uncharacterized protein [Aegilops tauschii subsp. strangulata]|uniref:uncharacterized protein n=1 Tax=Aegilops tauschii subsp. strangulata TaxID=200361 RepID=UPI003CC85A4C
MASLSREVLAQVVTLQTPAEVWAAIHATFAAHTQAQEINNRIELANLHKGNSTMVEYLAKIKALTDEIATISAPLTDREMTSYILKGLDLEYNSVVSALQARVEPITTPELYSQLLSFEARVNLLQGTPHRQSSVNSASRGRGNSGRDRGHQGRGRGGGHGGRGNNQALPRSGGGDRGGGYNNNNTYGTSSNSRRTRCQLCKKPGHEVIDCWHRFDEDLVPDAHHAAAAIREQGGGDGDTVWYAAPALRTMSQMS